MKTAIEAYRNVASAIETIKNGEHAHVELDPGQAVRQGDIYVVMLDKPLAAVAPYAGRQLAEGTTQGSRHVAEGDVTISTVDESAAVAALNRLIPATRGHDQYVGPQVVAAAPWTATHPEHGDRTLPAGAYLVTYQKTAVARAHRRVLD